MVNVVVYRCQYLGAHNPCKRNGKGKTRKDFAQGKRGKRKETDWICALMTKCNSKKEYISKMVFFGEAIEKTKIELKKKEFELIQAIHIEYINMKLLSKTPTDHIINFDRYLQTYFQLNYSYYRDLATEHGINLTDNEQKT